MEYYLLAQSEHVVNPMKVIGPNLEGYPHEMTHRQFAGLEDAVVGYVRYDETQEIPDILSQPTYMVSEAIKKCWQCMMTIFPLKRCRYFQMSRARFRAWQEYIGFMTALWKNAYTQMP